MKIAAADVLAAGGDENKYKRTHYIFFSRHVLRKKTHSELSPCIFIHISINTEIHCSGLKETKERICSACHCQMRAKDQTNNANDNSEGKFERELQERISFEKTRALSE